MGNLWSGRAGARQAGFTLLELLVAMAVFSLVVLGLTQGLRFGIQGWGAQSRETRNLADLDSVDRLLRELLSSVVVREDPGFTGTEQRLRFVGLLPRAAPATIRLENISLLVTPDGFLALSWAPPLVAGTTRPPPEPTVTPILGNVADLKLAYFAGDRPIAGGKILKAGWRTRWDDSGHVPTMIRIHIDFADGDPRHWPDIIVAPMVQGK